MAGEEDHNSRVPGVACMRERGGTHSFRPRRILSASLIISIVITSLMVAAASNPILIGTWFTIYTEERDGVEVYKVEVMATSWSFNSHDMTGVLELDVRVTNNHPVDIHITKADFVIKTLPDASALGGEVTLTFLLEDMTIGSGLQETDTVIADVVKLFGVGNKYVVEGVIEWEDIFPFPDPRGTVLHIEEISEVHSITELMPPGAFGGRA